MRSRAIRDLSQLSDRDFFPAVAQGLSAIFENVARIADALAILNKYDDFRGARILELVAKEEAAKYLILLDAVRCPRKPGDRFTAQLEKFNDHLAKGLYAEACNWRPKTFRELKELIEGECHEYYLDGPNDVDWIFENRTLRRREEAFYVDYVDYDGEHDWLSPKRYEDVSVPRIVHPPAAIIGLIDDLSSAGFSEPSSLELFARLWRPVSMTDATGFAEVRDLIRRTLQELHANGEAVSHRIAERWPFPLYDLQMRLTSVKKSQLKEVQSKWYPEL